MKTIRSGYQFYNALMKLDILKPRLRKKNFSISKVTSLELISLVYLGMSKTFLFFYLDLLCFGAMEVLILFYPVFKC